MWKQVWTEEEIANNGSTPIFLLSGKKRESFCLNDISVEPGNVWTGYLELGQGEFRLPAAVLHGTRPGKTMLITAGVHGGEYVGIQAAIELSQKLKIQKVAGTIIIVKVINVPAFERRNGSMGLTDGKNLNREFPGNPKGTEMERLAWAVSHELQPAADYYIDLHSGDDYEQLTSYVYYAGMADEKQSVSQDAWQSRWTYLTWSAPMWRQGALITMRLLRESPVFLLSGAVWEPGPVKKYALQEEMSGIFSVIWEFIRGKRITELIILWMLQISVIRTLPGTGCGIPLKSPAI